MSNWQGGGGGWPPPGGGPGYGPPPQQQQGYGPPPQQQQQGYGYGPPPGQQGYGPPQGGAPMQPYGQQQVQAWPNAGMMGAGGAPTVLGVQLLPGERVIYYHEPNYTVEKVVLWVFGVLFLVVIIGLIFIIMVLLHDRWNPKAQIVTNQRVIEISGKGVPSWFPLGEACDLNAERQNTGGGGGLIGMAVVAVVNSLADNKSKMETSYWKRTQAIIVIGRSGSRFKMKTREPLVLGPFLARVVLMPGSAEQCPSVPYQA
jgi:hypothetical protein